MRYDLDFWRPGFTPSRDFNAFQRNFNRLFDGFFQGTGGGGAELIDFNPAVDVEETEEGFKFYFDLPGVKKEDLKIELLENRLKVSGVRNETHESKKKNRQFYERQYGKFERSFTLPGVVDAKQVEARYDNGVLMVQIPKTEEYKAQQIQIKEGHGQSIGERRGGGQKIEPQSPNVATNLAANMGTKRPTDQATDLGNKKAVS